MIIDKIIKIIVGIIFFMICISNISILPILLALIVIFIIFNFIRKRKISERFFLIIIISVTFISRLICIFQINTPLESDFETLFNISNDFVDGDLDTSSQKYINNWPFQVPFILYQSVLVKICNNPIFLKIINAVLSVGITIFIYYISKKISNRKSAEIVTLLYSVVFGVILYNNILTNQYIFTLLIMIAINTLLTDKIKNQYIKMIIVSILIGIANLLRPEGIIVILSFICFEIYQVFVKNANLLNTFKKLVILVAVYMIICNGTMYLLKKANVIKNDEENDILFKFVIGLNVNTNGRWSEQEFSRILNSSLTMQERKQLEKELIIERIKDKRILSLMIKKVNNYWNDFEYFWSIGYLSDTGINIFNKKLNYDEVYKFIYSYDQIIWMFILIMFVLSIKKCNNKSMLLYIIVIGNFIIYLFIEVQGRYAFYSRVIIFILASKGIKYLLQKYKILKRRLCND